MLDAAARAKGDQGLGGDTNADTGQASAPDGLAPGAATLDPEGLQMVQELAEGVTAVGDPLGNPGAELQGDSAKVQAFMEGQPNLNWRGMHLGMRLDPAGGKPYKATDTGLFQLGSSSYDETIPGVVPVPEENITRGSGWTGTVDGWAPTDPLMTGLAKDWVSANVGAPSPLDQIMTAQNWGPNSNVGIYNEEYMKLLRGM